jgi:outer membrane protein TolC
MSARPFSILVLLLPLGCVAYQSDAADVATIAAEVAAREGGSFTFDAAVLRTLRQHPELRAAEARARAAGAARTVPLPATGEWRGRNEAVGVMLDPIALLGFGPRGAAIEAAEARAVEAATQLAVARWRALGELAEAFALHHVATTLPTPELDLDVAAFERSGLASPVAAAMLRAATARARSERLELARLGRDQLARLRHLLGLPATAALDVQTDEPSVEVRGDDRELLARPDLALAVARFEVADRDFRKAVTDQYPSFQIGPNVSLRGDPLRAMGMLNIPFAMHGLAAAARDRREAARHDVEDALLEARREASVARDELQTAAANRDAARSALTARQTAFDAARAALEVEPDAFQPFARAASEYLQAIAEHRRASSAHAVATVRFATAHGWPRVPETEEQAR